MFLLFYGRHVGAPRKGTNIIGEITTFVFNYWGLMTPMLSSAGFVCLPVSRGLLGGI